MFGLHPNREGVTVKVTLDMSGLRKAVSGAIMGLKDRSSLDTRYIDAQVIDHLQDQFDVEGMTEDGATGTFTRNDPGYDWEKSQVYGETRRMHKTLKLREAVATAPMDIKTNGGEITFGWSWDAISPSGENYAAKYQNDSSEEGRHLVLTDQFLEDLAEDISAEVSDKIERALSL